MLKKFYDDITIFCYANSKVIYELIFDGVQYIIVDESKLILGKRIINGVYRKKLKEIEPNKIFDLTGSILSASLIFSSSSNKIIGYNDYCFKALYSDFILKRTTPHLTDLYLDPVLIEHKFDMRLVEKEYEVCFDENGTILIHPFAGWDAKEWNLNKFIKFTELLNVNFKVLWIFPEEKVNENFINLLNNHSIKF